MTAPLPYPSGQALLGETDLHIRSLAYATDVKLAGATRFFTTAGTSQTDVNGEFVVSFPASVTLTGCIVLEPGFETYYGQVRDNPPIPPGTYRPPINPAPVSYTPRQFLPNGLVWVRAMTNVWRGSGGTDNTWYGSQPITAGVTLRWAGIAWGPAS